MSGTSGQDSNRFCDKSAAAVGERSLWFQILCLENAEAINKITTQILEKPQGAHTGERVEASRMASGGKVGKPCEVDVSLNELTVVQTRGGWAVPVSPQCTT